MCIVGTLEDVYDSPVLYRKSVVFSASNNLFNVDMVMVVIFVVASTN